MLTVRNCCCCFDLKHGFYTFGIISLLLRLTSIVMIFYGDFLPLNQTAVRMQLRSMMPLLGYMIGSAIALFIAIKGIIQKRSILIYPYIVILVCEIIVGITMYLILTIAVSVGYLIMIPFSGGINIYILICLISLYKQIQRSEQNKIQSKGTGMDLPETV